MDWSEKVARVRRNGFKIINENNIESKTMSTGKANPLVLVKIKYPTITTSPIAKARYAPREKVKAKPIIFRLSRKE